MAEADESLSLRPALISVVSSRLAREGPVSLPTYEGGGNVTNRFVLR